MATTKSGTPTRSRTATKPAGTKRAPATAARKPAASKSTTASIAKATAGNSISAAADSVIKTVKARPLTAAAIAAGAAGAGALLWAKRGQIAEQAEALSEKASELGGRLGEKASTLGGKIGDQATALGEKAGEIGDKVKARFAADDAAASLTTDTLESTATQQSKVGAVSY